MSVDASPSATRVVNPYEWSFERRFMRRVKVTSRGCWRWTGALMRNGYGQLKVAGVAWAAHRYSYTMLTGPIPDGLDLDHLCRHRWCVNPDHLEPVTRSENLRRGNVGTYWSTKTHCPHGHAYDEANTAHRNGRRHCRACDRQRAARRRNGTH